MNAERAAVAPHSREPRRRRASRRQALGLYRAQRVVATALLALLSLTLAAAAAFGLLCYGGQTGGLC